MAAVSTGKTEICRDKEVGFDPELRDLGLFVLADGDDGSQCVADLSVRGEA